MNPKTNKSMIKNYLLLLVLFVFSSVNSQIINIPDANFKAKLLQANKTNTIAQNSNGLNIVIDINGDGEIQTSEASNVYSINLSKSNISSLVGIKSFNNLTNLFCPDNQIVDLDVSGMLNLTELYCNENKINNLNLLGLTNLTTLFCRQNNITNLDLGGYNMLKTLYAGLNPISYLNITAFSSLQILDYQDANISNFDVSKFKNLVTLYCVNTNTDNLNLKGLVHLKELYCSENNLTTLDLSDQVNLTNLNCYDNPLLNLDIEQLVKLEVLTIGQNNFESIDLSNSKELIFISAERSSLKSIDLSYASHLDSFNIIENSLLEIVNLKNGSIEKDYSLIKYNDKLKYVCTDDNEFSTVESLLLAGNQTNINLNTYCSFVPGGEIYTVKGKGRVDLNNNGCDLSDVSANLKFDIVDGLTNGTIISNAEDFLISVPEGNYTITPKLEKPEYFTVYPLALQVDFPMKPSPFTQDFCITPVGVYPDLEILLIPILDARPGFNSVYKVVFKNNGNVEESGTINFNFDDSVLDLISSNFSISSQTTNKIVWNFSNLKPFEKREIILVLNANSPLETPAVNIGDIFKFKVSINSDETDTTPNDNIFEFNQTVLGSYDPNDKTCLEGDIIKPDLIGKYVHYLIRFENTGTYAAENIVVKDMIDLSKFDIPTLVQTSSSHLCTTKISEGNKVEFIFEKINLPFDDANNDGYIAFKIKTLPTLAVGDSFTNEARIYFDYNFPIITNKVSSTFKTLGTSDFEFSKYFNIFPNPVKDVLNISTESSVKKQSMHIYNILGQLVITVPHAENYNEIDVSKLPKGNYILKIKTELGTTVIKFLKN